MKNWKTIGQYFATGASGILLASFASLFAFSEAHAAQLIFDDDSGAVTRIEGLSVFKDEVETIYDVDFLGGTLEEVYGEDLNFDFADSDSAEAVTRAVVDALGTSNYLDSNRNSDGFTVPFSSQKTGMGHIKLNMWAERSFEMDIDGIIELQDVFLISVFNLVTEGSVKWAKFSVSAVETNTATTPEPTAIFSLLALGVAVLGGALKRQYK